MVWVVWDSPAQSWCLTTNNPWRYLLATGRPVAVYTLLCSCDRSDISSPLRLVSCLSTSVRRVMTVSMVVGTGSVAGGCCAVAKACWTSAGCWTGLGVGTGIILKAIVASWWAISGPGWLVGSPFSWPLPHHPVEFPCWSAWQAGRRSKGASLVAAVACWPV